jgi:hypothetical protein
MEALDALARELAYPGAERLYRAAERRGLGIPRSIVNAYVRTQSHRQVLAPRPRYNGKVVATGINDRFAADLIHYSTRTTKGGYQYILIVQDIFSRKIWAVATKDKTAATTTQAFEHIIESSGKSRLLDTDDDAAFEGLFGEYLNEHEIEHSVADSRNKNARGSLDAAIRSFKVALTKLQVAEGTRDWSSQVRNAANAYNKLERSALIGRDET